MSNDLSDQIYELLRKSGPHCATELSLLTGMPLDEIWKLLSQMQEEGLIEEKPEGARDVADYRPWRLARKRVFPRR